MATLTQLEYLLAVDRLRHFAKAAKACHVSQPTLSMQLQKLEQEYGLTFFDRSKQPILPTDEGRAVIEQARAVLREFGKLDHLCRNRDSLPVGEFRLALIPTIAPYLLPLFLGSFVTRFPGVKLTIEERTTDQIIRGLEQDEIDAGILATPLQVETLVEKPLYYEPFSLYVSDGHPLAGRQVVKEEELDARGLWLLSEGHCLRNQVVRICSLRGNGGVFPSVKFESGSLETLMHLVDQGHGYTLVPSLVTRTLSRSRRDHLRDFSHPIPSREVSLVSRRTQYKRGILEALAAQVQESLPAEIPREKQKGIQVVRI